MRTPHPQYLSVYATARLLSVTRYSVLTLALRGQLRHQIAADGSIQIQRTSAVQCRAKSKPRAALDT